MPRQTVAPASPSSRALWTMTSYSGRPSQRSDSPTKMRSSLPSPVIFIADSQHPTDHGTDPDRGQAADHRGGHAAQREDGLAVAQQGERFVAEGRHGGE